MTTILQVFMRYKISEFCFVFNGEYHEHIKNVQNQIHFIQKLLKN